MEINKVNSLFSGINATTKAKNTNVPEPVQNQPVDKLQISEEAKMISKQADSTKDYAQIKERINSDFYFSDEVTNKVAEALLSDIKNPE